MSVRRYSYAEIKASLSPEKRRADGPWTRFVLRPLSMPAAWLCMHLGMGANQVSYLGALCSLAGGALLALGSPPAAWAGLALLFAFGVLDCADGNIARTVKAGSVWGEWVDAVCGYVAYAAALLGAGACAELQSPGLLPLAGGLALPWPGSWGLVGGLAASGNLFMRLAYSGYRRVRPEPASLGAEKGLSETIGITGLLVPAMALGYASGALALVVLAYALVYCGGALVVTVKLLRRAEADTVA